MEHHLPLTFATLDDLAFAAERGRLFPYPQGLVLTASELGPLLELQQLQSAGCLTVPADSLHYEPDGTAAFCDAMRGRMSWVCPSARHLGFFRTADSFPADDTPWIQFGLAAQKAAMGNGIPKKIAAQLVGALGEMHSNIYEHSGASGTVALVTSRDGEGQDTVKTLSRLQRYCQKNGMKDHIVSVCTFKADWDIWRTIERHFLKSGDYMLLENKANEVLKAGLTIPKVVAEAKDIAKQFSGLTATPLSPEGVMGLVFSLAAESEALIMHRYALSVDSFLESMGTTALKLPIAGGDATPGRAPETIDALFHLPLLALAVMVIARRTPFQTMILGRKVTLLLVEHFAALRKSPHGLETSLTLRRRCADALAFLEAVGLVMVSQNQPRMVTLSPAGRTRLDHAIRDMTDLGLFVRQLQINYERVVARIGNEH